MRGTIHVPDCPGLSLVAQARITSSKAESKRTSAAGSSAKRATGSRKERCSRNSGGKRTMRGSVLHHRIGCPSENHGKIPDEYARSRLSMSSAPPAASRPGARWRSSHARDGSGNGSLGSSQGRFNAKKENANTPRHNKRGTKTKGKQRGMY